MRSRTSGWWPELKILLTGGTGHLGREFARQATGIGHEIRIVSRQPRPVEATTEWAQADLGSGAGLDEAVAGMDAVLHAASDPTNAAVVDVVGTRHLAEAALRASVGHFVFVSIVGIDRIPFPYYRRKLEAEGIIRDVGIPHTILRAAQFHYFVDLLLTQLARARLVLPVPMGFRIQSIAVPEVAAVLRGIVEREPAGLLPGLYGPEPMTFREAARVWREVRGMRRPIVALPIPGRVAAAFRAGRLTDPARPGGRQTWREWLEVRYS